MVWPLLPWEAVVLGPAKPITLKGAISPIYHNEISKVDISSFCKVVIQGNLTMVQCVISLGANVNQKSLGMTTAIFAGRYNKAEILELLTK